MNETPDQLVEHFFRHESAKLVSVLTRVFGFSNLPIVEDTVQAALLEALQNWKLNGIPQNPTGWVHRVAKNKAIDVIRRKRREQNITERIAENFARSGQRGSLESGIDELFVEDEIGDSLLQMIFACCSPRLDRQSQIAICLKILCGFNVREIASALLIGVEAAKKRVQRAKKSLQQANVKLEIPNSESIPDRLASVHEVLYLMFNEGYSASAGDQSIRQDLCEEAARLCHLLCQKESTSNSSTQALLALMLFHAARFESRTRSDGSIVRLQDQDRSQWDRKLIMVAERWFSRSAQKDHLSTFHLEAGIALQHCRAQAYQDTDWKVIVCLYDRLIELLPTPIYILNRAIAKAEMGQAESALIDLRSIADEKEVQDYSHLNCALAYIYGLQGTTNKAIEYWTMALDSSLPEQERIYIEAQLQRLKNK